LLHSARGDSPCHGFLRGDRNRVTAFRLGGDLRQRAAPGREAAWSSWIADATPALARGLLGGSGHGGTPIGPEVQARWSLWPPLGMVRSAARESSLAAGRLIDEQGSAGWTAGLWGVRARIPAAPYAGAASRAAFGSNAWPDRRSLGGEPAPVGIADGAGVVVVRLLLGRGPCRDTERHQGKSGALACRLMGHDGTADWTAAPFGVGGFAVGLRVDWCRCPAAPVPGRLRRRSGVPGACVLGPASGHVRSARSLR